MRTIGMTITLATLALAGCGSASGGGANVGPGDDGGAGTDGPIVETDGEASDSGTPGSEGGSDSGNASDGGKGADGGKGRDSGSGPAGLHASGNQILDGSGKVVRLLGVNRSGSEYSCIHGTGFFDGPVDQASITAITGWKANAVRVPLNEDCWLGINGAPAPYSGAAYQAAIAGFVDLLLQNGIYPIIELHWTAPGTMQAMGQNPMPDQDHSVTFWSQVAAAYASKPDVILELFNEPYPDSNQDTTAAWTCWRDGGTCQGISYPVAGMQSLVDAVRGAGARNLVLLGGVQYSNSLSQWVAYEPSDPENNLAAAWHVYDNNVCNTTACYDQGAASVVAKAPLVTTEIGESDCAGGFITTLMGWLDQHGQSYLGWTWDTWGGCLVLVTDYLGTPAGTYGQTYKDHLLATPH